MKFLVFGVLCSAFTLVATTFDVAAATSNRYRYQTAAKDCQGALPAFAGTLRARPLALGNEGEKTAFVTCGFVGDGNYGNETTHQLAISVGNNGPDPVTITCTLVEGFGGSVYSANYWPSSVTVDTGTSNLIFWNAGAYGPASLERAQVSCSLPPGALLYRTSSFGTEEVGA